MDPLRGVHVTRSTNTTCEVVSKTTSSIDASCTPAHSLRTHVRRHCHSLRCEHAPDSIPQGRGIGFKSLQRNPGVKRVCKISARSRTTVSPIERSRTGGALVLNTSAPPATIGVAVWYAIQQGKQAVPRLPLLPGL